MQITEVKDIKSFLKAMSSPRSKTRREKKAKLKEQRKKDKISFFTAFELNKQREIKKLRNKKGS